MTASGNQRLSMLLDDSLKSLEEGPYVVVNIGFKEFFMHYVYGEQLATAPPILYLRGFVASYAHPGQQLSGVRLFGNIYAD